MNKDQIKKVKERILSQSSTPLAILPDEQSIIKEIKRETQLSNTNNVTRTKAYLDFYSKHPEIHWSFLAHMVSRNAGYHMTDLKGELLPSILDQQETENFFLFLETANSYIFHDAYPQLLLYRKSIEEKKSLFHLLPAFGVSKAMSVFWERFWENRNSTEITLSLIINEQSMLQKRLLSKLSNSYIQEKALFLLQDRLELTTVFFPYKSNVKSKKPYSLAGTSISHFELTEKRIEIGKKLYAILYMKKHVKQSATQYALSTPHTGSRCDYWPESYSSQNNNNKKIFSPSLKNAWKDISHSFLSEDWVNKKTIQHFDTLQTLSPPKFFDVTVQSKILVKLSTEFKAMTT
ncbi:MAG: DUF2515 family protein [Bacillota bacterium]